MSLCNRLTSICLVFLASVVPCTGGEPEKPVTPSAKEIAALVDQLASANKRPKGGREPLWVEKGPILPPGFNPKEQSRVGDVCVKLVEAGTAAFPSLIEKFEDERYSVTVEQCTSEAAEHMTVGEICHTLIMDQLQPYGFYSRGGDELGRPRRPLYPFPESKKEAAEWWGKHKNQTLDQLQLEVLDWIIAKEDEGRKDGRKYPDAERSYLRDLKKKLSEGKKPLAAGNSSSYRIIPPGGFAGIK